MPAYFTLNRSGTAGTGQSAQPPSDAATGPWYFF
jgi:hypothetical protein